MPFPDNHRFGSRLSGLAVGKNDSAPGERVSRRAFLRTGAGSAMSVLCGLDRLNGLEEDKAFSGGSFIGRLAFEDEEVAPVNRPIGSELDGRLYTDLSEVSTNRTVTPTSRFFVRSAASRLLPAAASWTVSMSTADGARLGRPLDLRSLRATERAMGRHLMECAGNVRLTRFGLISVADWVGVPIAEVMGRAGLKPPAWVQISGFDDYAEPSATSIPGAAWIFNTEQLNIAGAFLATGMNGQPLTPDHGAPVRLVVPGWYGCSCIKWVNSMAIVDREARATSQMREYAVRTLQPGIPDLARDFQPATIDHAALPVRIEKWRVEGRIKYRVVGILWGGSAPVRGLRIRFNSDGDFEPVADLRQVKTDPWTIWTHSWSPSRVGMYSMRLAVMDPEVTTRKLNLGLYDRSVRISEI